MTKNISLLIVTLALFLITPAYAGLRLESPTDSLDNGLVGYWTFDGADISGTTALDKSPVGTNTGTITGATKAMGKIGQALKFNGVDDYISTNLNLTGATAATFAFWVKQSSTGGSNYGKWLSGNVAERNSYDIGIDRDVAGRIGVWISGVLFMPIGLSSDVWQHVTIVFSGSSYIKAYLNGSYWDQRTDSVPSQIGAHTGNQIGANVTSGFYSKSLIDDVRVYNRALAANEIKRLYNMGAATKVNKSATNSLTSGLVGYWTFDGADISGTTALDKSPVGTNTGTITGATKTIGKIGQGLSFNGTSNYVSTGSSGFPTGSGARAVFAWVYITGSVSGYHVVQNYGTRATNQLAGLFIHDGNVFFGGYANDFASTFTPSPNSWHLIGYSYTAGSSNMTVYMDGQSQTGALPNGALNTILPVSDISNISKTSNGTNDEYFPGLIDDVRVYNRALSANEVKRLYNMGAATKVNKSPTNSLTTGLVGYWTFDGADISGDQALDRSPVGTNTGTINGATKTIGKLGQALKFNGTSDYVGIPSCDSFQFGTGDFAISLWVNWSNTAGYQCFTDGGYSSNAGVLIETNGDQQKVRVYLGTTFAGGPWDWVITTNTWYHFVATRAGTNLSIFVNGSQVGSPSTNSTSITKYSYFIGKYSGGEFFKGEMDDVRFYSRALSANEVKRLYNMGR